MKQRTGMIAVISAVGLLLGGVVVGMGSRTSAASSAALKEASTEAVRQASNKVLSYSSQAPEILKAVIVPLDSLRIMQRAIANSPESNASEVPTLALLNAPLKTTGYGPILIGMSLNEVVTTGLKLLPLEENTAGECQYYRIANHAEPVVLMAIDDRILRIDIWPGSLTETLSGAKIGSSEQELVNYYGDRLDAVDNPMTGGKTITFTPKDPGEAIYRLVFETDARGRVVQYRAGQFPAVTWPEGCF